MRGRVAPTHFFDYRRALRNDELRRLRDKLVTTRVDWVAIFHSAFQPRREIVYHRLARVRQRAPTSASYSIITACGLYAREYDATTRRYYDRASIVPRALVHDTVYYDGASARVVAPCARCRARALARSNGR